MARRSVFIASPAYGGISEVDDAQPPGWEKRICPPFWQPGWPKKTYTSELATLVVNAVATDRQSLTGRHTNFAGMLKIAWC